MLGILYAILFYVATLILISSITLLLYASGVEVSADREIDLNRELRACGSGNLAAAFSVSPPGYTIITMSVLSHRLGAFDGAVGRGRRARHQALETAAQRMRESSSAANANPTSTNPVQAAVSRLRSKAP